MTFREFADWCNARACDGCWGMGTAIYCAEIIREISAVPFWRRRKVWEAIRVQVEDEIVNPINTLILESLGGMAHDKL